MSPYLTRLPDFLPGPLGGHPIFSYGVMLGIAFMLGWGLTVFLAEKEGYHKDLSGNTLFVAIVGALIGARLFFFFSATDQPLTIGNFLKFAEGGMVAYGGYIGGLVSAWAYMKWKGANFMAFVDIATPTLALGLGIVRIGCFLYGCDYGLIAEGHASLHFPQWDDPGVGEWIRGNAPAFDAHSREGLLYAGIPMASAPVYPTQLIASIFGFALFGALLLFRRLKRFDGQVLMYFLIAYSVFRFVIEFQRGDLNRGVGWFGTPFSTSQLIAIALIVFAAGALYLLGRREKLKENS